MTHANGLSMDRFFHHAVESKEGSRSVLAGSFLTGSLAKFTGLAILMTAAMSIGTANAAAVVVDGDLTDLILKSSNPYTGGSAADWDAADGDTGIDPYGRAGTEGGENAGFDIDQMYSYFSIVDDTLYVGFTVNGGVLGDGCGTTIGSGIQCNGAFFPGNINSVFDLSESILMQLDIGTADGVWEAQRSINGDSGAGIGPDTINAGLEIDGGGQLVINHAVADNNNSGGSVEFSISNLLGSGILPYFSETNPIDIHVRFVSGSATNALGEDAGYLTSTLVPVPAAVWLFGSALLGLMGLRQRKQSF